MLLDLVRLGKFSVQELCLLADFERPIDVDPMIEMALHAVPDDPLPLLARAQIKVRDNQPAEATLMLWRIGPCGGPIILTPRGLLGEVLMHSGTERDFQEWKTQWPPEADKHPGIWFGARPVVRKDWPAGTGGALVIGMAIRIESDHLRNSPANWA